MATNRWPIKRLKKIVKGQPGSSGGKGVRARNVEIEDILDRMSDDHTPGNEQGAEQKDQMPDDAMQDGGKPGGEIDENGNKIDSEIQEGAAKGQEEGAQKEQQANGKQQKDLDKRPPGQRGKGSNQSVDYAHLRPKFNWKHICQRFISSALPKAQESYTKPSRKSVTGMHVASQVGAAAIKPGEKIGEVVDLKLAFLLDCSGSMLGSVAQMFAEANKLLKDPRFAKSEVYVMKYSNTHEIYRGIFARDKAHRVKDIGERSAGKYELTMKQVFANAEGGGTEISQQSHDDTLVLLGRGYNCLLLTDTDILWPHNIPLVLDLIKRYPRQMFVVMRDRNCYIEWRKATGIATPNISHF